MNRLAELTQKIFNLGQKENLLPIEKELMRALTIELYDYLTTKNSELIIDNEIIEKDNETIHLDDSIINKNFTLPTDVLDENEETSVFPIEEEDAVFTHPIKNNSIAPEVEILGNNYQDENNPPHNFSNTVLEDDSLSIFPLETEPEPTSVELSLDEETEVFPEKLHLKELDESNLKEPIPEIPNFLKTNTVNTPIFVPVENIEPISSDKESINTPPENTGIVIEHAIENSVEKEILPEQPSPIDLPIVEIKNIISPKAYKSQLGVNDTFILLNELFDNNRKSFDDFFHHLSQYHSSEEALTFVKQYLADKKSNNEEEILPIFEDIIKKA